jgi:hypothetical protein
MRNNEGLEHCLGVRILRDLLHQLEVELVDKVSHMISKELEDPRQHSPLLHHRLHLRVLQKIVEKLRTLRFQPRRN